MSDDKKKHPLADAPPLPPWPVTWGSVRDAVESEYLYRAKVKAERLTNPKAYEELEARTNPSLDVECFERLLEFTTDLLMAYEEIARKHKLPRAAP